MKAWTLNDIALATSFVLGLALAGCSTSKSAKKSVATPANQSASAQSASEPKTSGGAEKGADTAETASQANTPDSTDTPLGMAHAARPFDHIITAGQPTPAQFDQLKDIDVHTVVNFRAADEKGSWDEEKKAKQMGLTYADIPVAGPQDLIRDKVEAFSNVLRKEEGDFLVHCGSSNRVGAMFALRAFWLDGKTPDQALAIGRKAGLTHMEKDVRQIMSKQTKDKDVEDSKNQF